MAVQSAYHTGCKLSMLLFAISLGLPLYLGGEYVAGFTVFALLFHTAAAVAGQCDTAMHLAAFLLPLFMYWLLCAAVSMKLFSHAVRLILFLIFLLSLIAAIEANTRLRVIPFGPSAVALAASMAILIIICGMSLYDKTWR